MELPTVTRQPADEAKLNVLEFTAERKSSQCLRSRRIFIGSWALDSKGLLDTVR